MGGATDNRLGQFRRVHLQYSICVIAALCFLNHPIWGHEERAEAGTPYGPLDGMVFAGKIGGDENLEIDDELHFKDGVFWKKQRWHWTVEKVLKFIGHLTSKTDKIFEKPAAQDVVEIKDMNQ